jgi:hypothetical protein
MCRLGKQKITKSADFPRFSSFSNQGGGEPIERQRHDPKDLRKEDCSGIRFPLDPPAATSSRFYFRRPLLEIRSFICFSNERSSSLSSRQRMDLLLFPFSICTIAFSNHLHNKNTYKLNKKYNLQKSNLNVKNMKNRKNKKNSKTETKQNKEEIA